MTSLLSPLLLGTLAITSIVFYLSFVFRSHFKQYLLLSIIFIMLACYIATSLEFITSFQPDLLSKIHEASFFIILALITWYIAYIYPSLTSNLFTAFIIVISIFFAFIIMTTKPNSFRLLITFLPLLLSLIFLKIGLVPLISHLKKRKFRFLESHWRVNPNSRIYR